MILNLKNLFELYLTEDCPHSDTTTELLNIHGFGRMDIKSRENGVAACTEYLAKFLNSEGIKPESFIRSGEEFEKGDMIFSAIGELEVLFRVWRVSQTFLSITSAIATKTKILVEKARKINPEIMVATTRKTHPGFRYFEQCAVRAGGGYIHRKSLSDSVLITQNHLNIKGDIGKIRSLKKIEIEPRSEEEAVKYAKTADVLLLDHFSIDEIEVLIPYLKKINPDVKVAVSGDIDEENIENYAHLVDIVITSAPYYTKPINLTTEINMMNLDYKNKGDKNGIDSQEVVNTP